MGFPAYLKEKLLPILVSRTVVFLFVMGILTLFLYGVGTVQGFIDTTQLALLRLYVVLGIFLTIFSAAGIIIDLRRFINMKKKRYLIRAGIYLVLVIFGIFTVLAVIFILTLSGGNAGI